MSTSPADSDIVLPEWIAARAAAHRAGRARARVVPVARRAETSPDSDSDSDSDGEESGGVRLDVSPYRPPHVRAGLAQSQSLTDNYGSETTASSGSDRVDESQAATDGDLSPVLPAHQRAELFQVGSVSGGDLFGSAEETDESGPPRLDDLTATADGNDTPPPAVRAPVPGVFGQFQMSPSTGSTSSGQGRMLSLAASITSRLPSRGGLASRPAHRVVTALPATANLGGLTDDSLESTDTTRGRQFRTPGPRLAPTEFARWGNVARRAVSYASAPANVDAQEIFPEEACLYAANLATNHTHDRNAAELHRHFSQFGHCIIKMKNKDGLPMAFVQFTQLEHAMTALAVFGAKKARGEKTMILGREIRLEVARGNRPWVVSKRDGTDVGLEEAKSLLRPSGEIASADYITPEIQTMLHLAGRSVLVKFKEFKPDRSLHRDFRDTAYKIFKFEPEKRTADPEDIDPEVYLAEEAINMRSIFIKPIPFDMTEDCLKAIFEEVGDVAPNGVRLNMDARPHAIAFVQFTRDDMPDTAVRRFHGLDMGWGVLRVERKLRRQYRPLGRRSVFANTPTDFDPRINSVRRVLGASSVRRQQSTYVTPLRRNATVSAALIATAPPAARELVVRQPEPELTPPTQTAIETHANTVANAQRESTGPSSAPPAAHTQSTFSATAAPFAPQIMSFAPVGVPTAYPGHPMAPAYTGPLVQAPPSYAQAGPTPPAYRLMSPHPFAGPQQYGMPAFMPSGAPPAGWPTAGFQGGFPVGFPYQANPYAPVYNAPAYPMYADQMGNYVYGYDASNNSGHAELQTPGVVNTAPAGVPDNNVGGNGGIATGSPAIPAIGASGTLRPHTSNRSVSFAEPLVQPGNTDSDHE